MKETDAYAYLEEAFVSTFLQELLPGIFHNFANPLNGIMGRSRLLQRRMSDFVQNLRRSYPDMETRLDEDCRKLISDTDRIAGECDRFYDLFNAAAAKFYAINARDEGILNLARLVQAEMEFADFYLDFKHNIKKDVLIDPEAPETAGVMAFFSMALWALIRTSMTQVRDGHAGPFRIATAHDGRRASVCISPIGMRNVPGEPETPLPAIDEPDRAAPVPEKLRDLFHALHLLKQAHAGVEVTHDADTATLTISIPCVHNPKKGS